jgi:hypothetical protein
MTVGIPCDRARRTGLTRDKADERQGLIRRQDQSLIVAGYDTVNKGNLRFNIVLASRSVPVNRRTGLVDSGHGPGVRGIPDHCTLGSRDDGNTELLGRAARGGPEGKYAEQTGGS